MSVQEFTITTAPAWDGLSFPECPRWHDGRWWFSDMHEGRVYCFDASGRAEVVFEHDDRIGGLGWRGDELVAVSMTRRELLSVRHGRITHRVALGELAPCHCNDLIVDAQGRAYVGNFGFDFEHHEAPRATRLILVDGDGSARTVGTDLLFPNGMAWLEHGRELLVAESFGRRVSRYSVAEDGSLSQHAVFAEFADESPDGLCVDGSNAVWLASPTSRAVLRVERGGDITHRLHLPLHALACMLGGVDGKTLMICSAPLAGVAKTRAAKAGRIDFVALASLR